MAKIPVLKEKPEGLISLWDASVEFNMGIVRLQSWKRDGRLPVRAFLRAQGGKKILVHRDDVAELVANPPSRGIKGYTKEQVEELRAIDGPPLMPRLSALAEKWGREYGGVYVKWRRLNKEKVEREKLAESAVGPYQGTKRCAHCGLDLFRENFAKDNSRPDGLQSWCKACKSARRREPVAA